MMVLTRRGRLRHFSRFGFGFLLWERDRAEGEGEIRKREILMGNENGTRVTKQKCSDTVIFVGSMNSVKKLSDENKNDVAK